MGVSWHWYHCWLVQFIYIWLSMKSLKKLVCCFPRWPFMKDHRNNRAPIFGSKIAFLMRIMYRNMTSLFHYLHICWLWMHNTPTNVPFCIRNNFPFWHLQHAHFNLDPKIGLWVEQSINKINILRGHFVCVCRYSARQGRFCRVGGCGGALPASCSVPPA